MSSDISLIEQYLLSSNLFEKINCKPISPVCTKPLDSIISSTGAICAICMSSFKTGANLKTHIKKNHGENN